MALIRQIEEQLQIDQLLHRQHVAQDHLLIVAQQEAHHLHLLLALRVEVAEALVEAVEVLVDVDNKHIITI